MNGMDVRKEPHFIGVAPRRVDFFFLFFFLKKVSVENLL